MSVFYFISENCSGTPINKHSSDYFSSTTWKIKNLIIVFHLVLSLFLVVPNTHFSLFYISSHYIICYWKVCQKVCHVHSITYIYDPGNKKRGHTSTSCTCSLSLSQHSHYFIKLFPLCILHHITIKIHCHCKRAVSENCL